MACQAGVRCEDGADDKDEAEANPLRKRLGFLSEHVRYFLLHAELPRCVHHLQR